MNLIALNEAEAIIEPFWDGGTSDYRDPDPRYGCLSEYTVTTAPGAIAAVTQGWAFANLSVDKTAAVGPVLTLTRSCRLTVRDYDTFLLFASLPTCFFFDLSVTVDGQRLTLFRQKQGTGVAEEFSAPITGDTLQKIELSISSAQSGVQGSLTWLGLANQSRLRGMQSRRDQYDPEWPGYFCPDPPPQPAPHIGILLGKTEIPALRQKLRTPAFQQAYQRKKQQAQRDMAIDPEHYIGRYAPYYDQRWNRTRDRAWVTDFSKSTFGMHTAAENLAFVGLVENDPAMLRMAARHAICLAHCEYWSESPMGNLPGATWHHRSFTETRLCKCVALVLDWCGELLTPFGRQVLLDALVLKGLPRIESDFRRVEYIRSMNQGIVFAQGRIFALLALIPRYPRYRSCLAEAEADTLEMIDSYIQPDGGTLEGPSYWMFTFGEAVTGLYALARYHNAPFASYRKVLEKTGDYALSLMSMEENGTTILPINDAHPGVPMSCTLAGCFYRFTGDPRWLDLYRRLLGRQLAEDDSFALIAVDAPGETPPQEPPTPEKECVGFPVTGQGGVLRRGSDLAVRFCLCSGPTYASHFHEDKGSLILEAEGRTLCPDCGAANYHEAELFQLSFAQSHSLLYPVFSDGRLARQGQFEAGGKLTEASLQGNCAELASTDTLAWSGAPYAAVARRLLSPYPELVVAEDAFALDQADAVRFLLNSFTEWQCDAGAAVTHNGSVTLRVVPLNWQWERPSTRKFEDGAHRPVWQLAAEYSQKRSARLLTALILERQIPTTLTAEPGAWHFAHGTDRAALRTRPDGTFEMSFYTCKITKEKEQQ